MTAEAAPPAAPPPLSRRRQWLWIALIVSLGCNALVAGVVLRSIWKVRSANVAAGGNLETGLPAFVNSLPSDRREALRGEGFDRLRQLRPLRQELRRARAETAQAFLAEPFDRQALVAAQTRLLDAESNLRRAVQELVPDIAARMTAEERRAFLHWRAPGLLGGPPNSRRGRGPDGGDFDGRPERHR